MGRRYAGTGDPMVRVPIPDADVTLVIKDDGDNDHFVAVCVEDDSGWSSSMHWLRGSYDDDDRFIDALEDAFTAFGGAAPGGDDGPSPPLNTPPVFKCDSCNKSWPRRKNQTPDGSTDTCPDCI